jgi:isopenicillin-N N-acyltransferase-like protein
VTATVECRGDGRSRGRAHGEEARELVRTALARWEEATGAASGVPIDRYVRDFLGSTELLATTASLLPDLAVEIEGIAEGAGVRAELVAAYNLMDEQWWYDLGAQRGCSVVARADGDRVVVAQTMDLPAFMDGTQLVLRVADPDAPEVLLLTSAGLIGLTGVNRAGVAVCVNALLMLRSSARGLPVAAVVRGALRCTSLNAAVAFVRSAPHASGQHYALGAAEGIVGLECCAAGAVMSATGQRLVHTNHPLAHAGVDPTAVALLERGGSVANSHDRLRFLAAHADGVADVRTLLADRTAPICVIPAQPSGTRTFGAVAFELGQRPVAQFCSGAPSESPWQTIEWDDDGVPDG